MFDKIQVSKQKEMNNNEKLVVTDNTLCIPEQEHRFRIYDN